MARHRYKFNPETLSYNKVDTSIRSKILLFVPYIIGASIIGILFYFITGYLYETPQERKLRIENKKLYTDYLSINRQITYFDQELNRLKNNDDSLFRSLLGLSPLAKTIRQAGTGGHITNPSEYKAFNNTVSISSEQLETIQSRIKIQEKSYSKLWEKVKQNQENLHFLPAIMPVKNDKSASIGSGFGMRLHPILNIVRPHQGIDFNAIVGTPVYATADGEIIEAEYSTTFGNVIKINHSNNIQTLYAHLSDFAVHMGQKVKRGELIGYVGNTGLSCGPHVHYEVHVNGKEVNPVNYFFHDVSPEEYEAIALQSNRDEKSMD